jgi:2-isopropylmalate synthase
MDKKQVLEAISDSVSLACSLCDDVEWSAEDAVRTDKDFLFQAIEMAIKSGAKTVNIPDTVGYATPMEYFDLILAIKNNVSNIDKAIISTHCHNDLGLAVANSLAGAQAGARQIECTINGIGERAGNAALEELVMTLKTRPDIYNLRTNVNSKLITRASKLVSNITGFPIQYNKAIVGANAFAHESGIHQDGMLKNRNTYEIMTPESVGLDKSSLVLGKHSGRAAFKDKLQEIGYNLSDETLESSFKRFKDLADKKKEVLDDDIIAIIDNLVVSEKSAIKLIDLAVNCGKLQQAKVELELSIDGKNIKTSHESKDGPVDAIFSVIKTLIPHEASLELYQVNAVTSGIDAQAVVVVRLKQNNRTYSATGSSTDVLVASTKAYIHCLEKLPNLGSS